MPEEDRIRDFFERGPYAGFYPTDNSPTAYAECSLTVGEDDMLRMSMAQHEDVDQTEEMGTIAELAALAEEMDYVNGGRSESLGFKVNGTTIIFTDKVSRLLRIIPSIRLFPNVIITDEWQGMSHLGGTFLFKKERLTDKFRAKLQAQFPYPQFADECPRLKSGA